MCGEGCWSYLGRSASCPKERTERFAGAVIAVQKSAEGIVATEVAKARTMEGSKDSELMGAKRQNNQLELAFSKRSEGEARSGACEGTEVCVARAETERPAVFISLNPSNRHVRTRTRGGVGGEESRDFPLSRF